MARDWEDRVMEYVNSPRLRRRLRLAKTIMCTIDGNSGIYSTRAIIGRKSGDVCTCPVGEGVGGCKHTEALRRTYKLKPRSFADIHTVLKKLEKKEKSELMAVLREMVIRAPATLGALGIKGFDEDPGDDDE